MKMYSMTLHEYSIINEMLHGIRGYVHYDFRDVQYDFKGVQYDFKEVLCGFRNMQYDFRDVCSMKWEICMQNELRHMQYDIRDVKSSITDMQHGSKKFSER